MKVVEVVAGAALVAFSIFAPNLFPFALGHVMAMLTGSSLALGTSLVLGGVSGLISKGVMQSAQGRTITARQAAAPWRVIYGQCNLSGIVAFINAE